MPDPTPFISACLTNSSTWTTVDQTHSNEEKMQHVALEVKIVPWKEISIFLGENLTKKKKQRVLVMHLMGNQKTILQIDLRETPQEQSSSIKQKIFIINNGDQMLGGTALGVVLRLGRLGGSFSSSSQKRHRPLKAPFSLFFVIMGPNGPLFVKRYGSAYFEACLFFASGYDSLNRNVPRDRASSAPREKFLLPLLFCTPLCYCEVWSVYSDSVVLRWRGPRFIPWWQASLM